MARPAVLAYILAAVVLIADQASKFWALYILDLPTRLRVEVSGVFDLSMVWNRGVSFGLFRSPEGEETIRWLLAAFAAVISVILIWWVQKAKRAWSGVGIGFIIGGALGNLVDRVRFGQVADFLDFSDIGFIYVFNVADAAINVGVAILLLETFFTSEKDKTPL